MDFIEPQRKIFYNYYKPFRNLFKQNIEIEKFNKWYDFRKEWESVYEDTIIILPLTCFDLIGLDIRYQFREFGKKYENTAKFLLIGTERQVEFSLSQNDVFLRNMIDQLILPIPFDIVEAAIMSKVNLLERSERGKRG
jgi:hypothetical protein